jgi:cysteine desulfurase
MMRIYFDHNATTPLCSEAKAAMLQILDGEFGNPSSIHAEGRRARQLLELARDEVARLLGGLAEEIVFTSGGTEADNLALRSDQIVTSPLEHPAVLGSARGASLVRVEADGSISDLQVPPGTSLVSLAWANHEIGNLYPVREFAEKAHSAGAIFHSDAVQAAGKVPLSVEGLDLLSISAHKIGGPKGVGALWVRRGLELPALLSGGHQERERRPGTENIAGIVGFGAAARRARERLDREQSSFAGHVWEIASLRDRLQVGVVKLGARVNGGANRVGNTLNCAWDGVPGELLVAALDLAGVAASTGAACTSGSVQPSPVLLGLGQPKQQATEGVRFSLGAANSIEEVDRVLEILPELISRIRSA